jgi:outer membrane protein assembly factor BamB
VIASAQSGNTTAFDLRTGQRLWSQPAGMIGFPLVVGDNIFGVTTNAQVIAMSKLDGSVTWLTQLKAFGKEEKRKDRVAWIGPVLAGDNLVMASSEGRMVTVNAQTGAVVSESKVGKPVFVPPVIANQTVYLLTDDAKLVAYR